MFAYRGLLVHPHELDEVWIDQCLSLGLNMIGLHPVGGRQADQSLQGLLDLHGVKASVRCSTARAAPAC